MTPAIRPDYLAFGRPSFGDPEVEAVSRVLRSGWVGMGPETIAFERELAAYTGAPEVVAVDTCTSALFLSLLVHGVGAGDEVVCPSLTWCSTANAALYLGAIPVFCDVDAQSFCATAESILSRVTPRTRAVIAVHFGGRTEDMAALRRGLPAAVPIVEDAAHAFGARYPSGGLVGSSGNPTCFSFYANKNLSTAEGGAIALADAAQADRLRSLRQHALPIDAWKRFTHAPTLMLSQSLTELGYKSNYTDLQAAIGRVQLARQEGMNGTRLELARRYATRLAALAPFLALQADLVSPSHARHLFALRVTPASPVRRDDLLLELRRRNVGATIHYAPLHLMPLYRRGPVPPLPVTENMAGELLTLPISAAMQASDVDYVCDHLADILS